MGNITNDKNITSFEVFFINKIKEKNMESYAFFKTERFGSYTKEASQENPSERAASITATGTMIGAEDSFEVYNAHYDLKTNTEVFGYFGDELVYLDYYFTKKDYQIFYSEDGNLALFNTSHHAANKMVKELRLLEYKSNIVTDDKPIKLTHFSFNNKELVENGVLEEIKTAWIRLQRANLRSATLSGHDVSNDNYYLELIGDGELSALKLSITINNVSYDCILSEKGSFTITTKIPEDDTETRIKLFELLLSFVTYSG